MSLADLLQWIEQAGETGHVSVSRDGLRTWMNVGNRLVTAVSPPTGTSPPGEESDRADVTAVDRLLDLFLERAGRFEFVPRVVLDGGTPVALSLRVLVMEGLRHLDEWPRLAATYPSDTAVLSRTPSSAPAAVSPVQAALLAAASDGRSLAEARLRLSLSRPALLRRVEELRASGLVEVTGAQHAVDPIARLLAQAGVLVREQQFEEAAIVFGGLLSVDPSDARVRRMLREAEKEQVAALYQQLRPLSVVRIVDGTALHARKLSRGDREVAERVNGRWDVASLVLASPLREVETLRCLRNLLKLGIVDLVGGA